MASVFWQPLLLGHLREVSRSSDYRNLFDMIGVFSSSIVPVPPPAPLDGDKQHTALAEQTGLHYTSTQWTG